MAWVGLLDGSSQAIIMTASNGPAPDLELVSGIRFSADPSVPGGRTTVGQAIRVRRPAAGVNAGYDGDTGAAFAELKRRGYQRIISLPLVSGEVCLGVVVLHSKELADFDDEEAELLTELAGDISYALDYIKNEERVEYLAYHDPLTGLANRGMLHRRLSEAVAHATPEDGALALLLMNINNFRDINNTLGHNNGDLLLREIAGRVADALRETDLVACLGGDEFAILLTALADKNDVERVLEKLFHALDKRFVIQGLPVNVEPRLGIALYPDHGENADVLWQRADIVLNAAKDLHRRSMVYEPAVDHYDPNRLALIGGLRAAMDHNELMLHYQPRIDLATGRARGVEALLRWQHPDRGLIYPDVFIPLAERTGLIDALTTWVSANALRQGYTWHQNGLFLDISVNISARNLLDPHLCSGMLDLAHSSRFPVEMLRLEITESALMADPDRASSVLQELSDAGIRLSVDDFGTGHSSLAYIRDLPVSAIKIDKSFVMDFDQPRNAAIVSTAIELGHNLGMTVTAEGVEDETTYSALRDMGCDVAQGYFFSRPLPVDQLTAWLRDSEWRYAPD